MRVAPPVVITSEEQEKLESIARARSLPSRLVERARIVLLAAEGRQDKEIAVLLRLTPKKVARWRARFLQAGIGGLEKDAPRAGRPATITETVVERVIRKTTREKPAAATHWSTRTMADAVGISEASVRRIWHAHGLKPHLVKTFKVSNDAQFAEKLEDVVGLYLNPPEHAIVLSVDEKSQIQALDRTQPGLPLKRGRAGTMTHDYKRHGTTTLFAALDTLNGQVIGRCMDQHRHQEWLRFLRLIEQQTPPDKDLHLIVDKLRYSQTPEGTALAETAPAFPHPLHADQCFVAEHGGAFLSRSHRAAHSAWRLPFGGTTGGRHPGLPGRAQPQSTTVHLDGKGLGHTGKSQARPRRPR